jgi:hypothetical protein
MGLLWRGGAGSASGRAPLFSAPRQQKSAENENPLLEVVLNKPALVSAPSKNRSPADFGLQVASAVDVRCCHAALFLLLYALPNLSC